MTENEARQMAVEIEWNGKANVCIHCGNVPETYYIATGHDHTDDSIHYCFCQAQTQTIEQLTARVRELELVVSLKDEAIAERTDRVRELEEENARLNSEIEMLKSGKRSNIRLGMEIAASQAYAEQLREALQWAKAGFNQAAMGIIIQRELEENFNLCRDALALPRDTSALDAYVSEKMKEAGKFDMWKTNPYTKILETSIKQLTKQRDLAVEALEKQGHSAGCRKNAFGDICTCGLDDLLSTIKEIEAMAKGEQR